MENSYFEKARISHKYIKRTGVSGNYRYWYKDPQTGKLVSDKQSEASSPKKNPFKETDSQYRNGIVIDKSPYLSEAERQVERKFAKQIINDLDGNIQSYKKKFWHDGLNVINTDNARELSAEYEKDRARLSPAVHEPASALMKYLYQKDLDQPTPQGKENRVVFTAGGTGAGKSTAIDTIDEVHNYTKNSQLVYDTNLSGYGSAVKKIEQALDADKDAMVIGVVRDPVKSFRGAMARATRVGRTVPISEHVKTHIGFISVFKQLHEKYKDNPKVALRLIDNEGGKGDAKEMPLDSLVEINYNSNAVKGLIRKELESAYQKGKVSRPIYEGFLKGEGSVEKAFPSRGRRSNREGNGCKSEQENQATKTNSVVNQGERAFIKSRFLVLLKTKLGHEYVKRTDAIVKKMPIATAKIRKGVEQTPDRKQVKSFFLDLLKARFGHKYVKRSGVSGKYRYWYRDSKTGKLVEGKNPATKKKPVQQGTTSSKETGDKRSLQERVAKIAESVRQSRGAGRIPEPVVTPMEKVKEFYEFQKSSLEKNPDIALLSRNSITSNEDYGVSNDPEDVCQKGRAWTLSLDILRDRFDNELPALAAEKEKRAKENAERRASRTRGEKVPEKEKVVSDGPNIKTIAGRKLLELATAAGCDVPCAQCYVAEKRITGCNAKSSKVGTALYKEGSLLSGEDKAILDKAGGLRNYSFGDFGPTHFQAVIGTLTDLMKSGHGAGTYTKNLNFAEIFGDTGMKFNISTGADLRVGLPSDVVAEYTKRYPNVGSSYVAINIKDLVKAGNDPTTDKIIPVHLGPGTPRKFLEKITGADWESFDKIQSEQISLKTKDGDGKEVVGRPIKIGSPKYNELEHINEVRKLIKDGEASGDVKTYLDSVEKASVLIGQTITPKFKEYIGEPWYGKLLGTGRSEYGQKPGWEKIDLTKINLDRAKEYLDNYSLDIGTEQKYLNDIVDEMVEVARTKGKKGIEELKLSDVASSKFVKAQSDSDGIDKNLFSFIQPSGALVFNTEVAKEWFGEDVESNKGLSKAESNTQDGMHISMLEETK